MRLEYICIFRLATGAEALSARSNESSLSLHFIDLAVPFPGNGVFLASPTGFRGIIYVHISQHTMEFAAA